MDRVCAEPARIPFLQRLTRGSTPGARLCVLLLALSTILGLIDLELTLHYATSVGLAESNPLARLVMSQNSPVLLTLFKVCTMGTGILILYALRARRVAQYTSVAVFLVMASLVVRWGLYASELPTMDMPGSGTMAADDPRWVLMTVE